MSSSHAPLNTGANDDANIRQVVVIETRRGWQHQVQSIRTEVKSTEKFVHVTLYRWGREERGRFKYKIPTNKKDFTIFDIVYKKIDDGWYCVLSENQVKLYPVVLGKKILDLYASGKLFDRHES